MVDFSSLVVMSRIPLNCVQRNKKVKRRSEKSADKDLSLWNLGTLQLAVGRSKGAGEDNHRTGPNWFWDVHKGTVDHMGSKLVYSTLEYPNEEG